MSSRRRSWLARVYVSALRQKALRAAQEAKRRLRGQPHRVTAYLQLDDPYSYLLSCYLPAVAEEFRLDLDLRLTEAPGGDFRPDPERYASYALEDCRRLAAELGIAFLDRGQSPPVELRRTVVAALLAETDRNVFAQNLFAAMAAYWRGDAEALSRFADARPHPEANQRLAENQMRLLRDGHFQTATLHYAGEWYWGVDRLHFLVERLRGLGPGSGERADNRLAGLLEANRYVLPVTPPNAAAGLGTIEFYYSVRSPFSYLSLERTLAIADAFGLDIDIRPVLPMVMRGMAVPERKIRYLLLDAAREARRLGIPFGELHDPLGAGAERCLAAYTAAQTPGQARAFLLSAGRAIWSEGVDVATDRGLRRVVARAGLDWAGVAAALANDDWRVTVTANRDRLLATGSWGVPTVRLGDFVAWGQDRDWLLVRYIEDHCEQGDGILI